MELFSLKETSRELRIAILKQLGYDLDEDGIFVVDTEGKQITDPYVQKPVRFDNMAILPGSTIIIDDNLLSIASYMKEHKGLN